MDAPFLPYGRQFLDEKDVQRVVEALRSEYLTTGPLVTAFEKDMAKACSASFGVAVCNGTAALHCAMYALEIHPGDEVIVPAMTFAATANAILYQGGTPVFADVLPTTLCLDPQHAQSLITSRTKAIIAMDYAGQPADYDELQALCSRYGLHLVADACHSLSGSYKGRPVGSLAELNVFSFHPVKPMTTGEGGMILTDSQELAARMRRLRNHGMDADFRQREEASAWEYDITDLGWNYRLTDIQCALGLSQLEKLPAATAWRRELAQEYATRLRPLAPHAVPLSVLPDRRSSWHLFVLRVDFQGLGLSKAAVFRQLRNEGIGVNVHYKPVHLHSFYRQRLGVGPGLCPVAEAAYEQLLTLPLHPAMSHSDIARVVNALTNTLAAYGMKP